METVIAFGSLDIRATTVTGILAVTAENVVISRLAVTLVIILGISSQAAAERPETAPGPQVLWNILVYISSEIPNLDQDHLKYRHILEAAQKNDRLHLTVIFDSADPSENIKLTTIDRGRVIQNVELSKPINFGDPKTLTSFIEDNLYIPATYHGIFFAGDGGAYQNKYPVSMGYDFGSGMDSLTAMEIEQALASVASRLPDGKFDLVTFDACYMGSLEFLYQLHAVTHFAVASESLLEANAFPYLLLAHFDDGPENMAKALVQNIFNLQNISLTQAIAIDLTKLPEFVSLFRDFIPELKQMAVAIQLPHFEIERWHEESLLFTNMQPANIHNIDLNKWLTSITKTLFRRNPEDKLYTTVSELSRLLDRSLIARGTDDLKQVVRDIRARQQNMTLDDVSRWLDLLKVEPLEADITPQLLTSVIINGNPIPRDREILTNRRLFTMLKVLKRMVASQDELYWTDGLSLFLPSDNTELNYEGYRSLAFSLETKWLDFIEQVYWPWETWLNGDPYQKDNEDAIHDVFFELQFQEQ